MRHRKIDADISELRLLEIADSPPQVDTTDLLEDLLLDAGVAPSKVPAMVERLETVLDDMALREAGLLVAAIAARLEGCTAAVALRRVLVGDHGESLEEAAQRAGVAKQSLHEMQRKIAARVLPT
ncbi:MAG TPA: hypothetical protein VEH27_12120 [Methylomirabilota bacterium]|nr:hypothetical protein [Methylomirabilota bacterium]